jgi:hypothetical protein
MSTHVKTALVGGARSDACQDTDTEPEQVPRSSEQRRMSRQQDRVAKRKEERAMSKHTQIKSCEP